jgi:hypothetical protein
MTIELDGHVVRSAFAPAAAIAAPIRLGKESTP